MKPALDWLSLFDPREKFDKSCRLVLGRSHLYFGVLLFQVPYACVRVFYQVVLAQVLAACHVLEPDFLEGLLVHFEPVVFFYSTFLREWLFSADRVSTFARVEMGLHFLVEVAELALNVFQQIF